MLFEGVAPDMQFVGWEVQVGVADGQAADDRQLRRDFQLGSDDVRIPRYRNLHAGAQPPCRQRQHQSLEIHAHAHGIGRAKVPVHRDDPRQRCAGEIEVTHHNGGVSCRVRDGDAHRAVAVLLERLRQRRDVRRLMVGHSEQSVLNAIAGGPAGEHQSPRLDVGVRRRVLGQGFVDDLPGHRPGQKHPRRKIARSGQT
jgi:hypothetical protein